MKVGIFSQGQPLARLVRDAVEERRPGATLWVDLSDPTGVLSLDAEGITWQETELTGLDMAWVHGFPYTNPVIPAPEESVDWSVWQYRYLADQQRFSALYSLFSELGRRGVKMVHGPQVAMKDFMKHAQLSQLDRGGIAIPEMVCIQCLEDAESFSHKWPQVVWRPNTGRAPWQLFLRKQMLALADLGKPPILLAQVRPGQLLRIYMLDGKPVLCLAQFPPADNAPHETLEQFQCWSEIPEPESLAKAASLLGLHWCVFTCIWNGESLTFYDVDSDPVLSWLPVKIRDYLVASLSAFLVGASPPPVLDIAEPMERPNLFLRRMTRILYEFENSKYR